MVIMPETVPDHRYTRRQFLIMRSLRRGANWEAACLAVDKCIQNNPKWDGDDVKTYMEWEDERL
jgi:hypothetical protein